LIYDNQWHRCLRAF